MYLKWLKVIFFILLFNSYSVVYAEEFQIATIVNFHETLEVLLKSFTKNTGHKATITADAALNLHKQIKDGATFDILLSSDVNTPRMLEEAGLGLAGTRFTYSIGKLILWSPNPQLVDSKGEILHRSEFEHLVMINPKGPYGIVTQQVLEKMGVWENLQAKLIFVDTFTQMHQAIAEGKAQLGFTALSMLHPSGKIEGSFWMIPKNFYSPIDQQAILLKHGADNKAAKAFWDFLKSPQARNVIETYGYSLPK
ncbi:MAG: molybdate ABC transporter substrate-binding protein [Beggiatoa sp. IS2]|nr:MAG: molybdate ABC transporter substrate-binding protein [Beggiatoa sp. IS2]